MKTEATKVVSVHTDLKRQRSLIFDVNHGDVLRAVAAPAAVGRRHLQVGRLQPRSARWRNRNPAAGVGRVRTEFVRFRLKQDGGQGVGLSLGQLDDTLLKVWNN